ncbi:histidinol dehydrogenase [Clostridium sp. SYSU_GA19001]|uniref:histidinol dehydrogenase n=1 Tax=Clostridium caldaquaticum TaxID=2940653 RepID=UPI00207799C7|nr:histidinol dehydrogenase [Clostridium caldaquaticum]MCM8711446.1 histidinol dehydrogenase [Clostridium caldaquaticum]
MIKIVSGNSLEGKEYMKSLKERAEAVQVDVINRVNKILEDVKQRGEDAVIEYTQKFDSEKVNSDNFVVTKEEIQEAYNKADKDFIEALKAAIVNIKDFHEKQKRNSWITTKDKAVIMGQTIRGLSNVGIYVPGGTAAYPSSVLMNAVPAKVAGVENLYMVTPPSKDGSINPNILVAADLVGVNKIFKVGGAQAVGALAYGTESVPKVDKIVGPGNIYVAMAKRAVYGVVDIDMIAGPSEILIIADESADPKYVAADLMSQAEHDVLASSILVTTSLKLGEKVKAELERQIENLSRKDIIKTSLENYGAIIVVENISKAIKMANEIAPEHLEVIVSEPLLLLGDLKNAGSIFLGSYSPEPLGDYFAGPNHVLPTSGTARFFSPLSVDDFVKKSSYIYYSRTALKEAKDQIMKLAEVEGLTAHANSIKVRFEE